MGSLEKKIRIGLVPVHVFSLEELMRAFDSVIEQRDSSYVCFCEAHLCVCATEDPHVRRVLKEARFVLPDGVATTWGARLLGERFPERLSGPSVMLEVCRHGLTKGYSHFFYGGTQGVAERLAEKLAERFPGLNIAGTYCPPFRELTQEEDIQSIEYINSCSPDFVWVGLGAPKQETWMHEHLGKIKAPLMLGVGAAFDFHSGCKKWAPAWIRRIGLEWAYRMFTGGKRVFIRNAINESLFTAMMLRQALLRLKGAEED